MNHYEILRFQLPINYRKIISEKLNVSISLINLVLRGQTKDNKGIIICAYDLAYTEMQRRNAEAATLDILRDKLANLS